MIEAANFVSASASVFTPVIDRFDASSDDCYLTAPMAGSYLVTKALGSAHAFDAGNERIVEGIEEQRSIILAKTDEGMFYPHFMPEPLIEIDSAFSLDIQIADIAAGIARQIWHQTNLVTLVRHFDYVTYNSKRLSEAKAAACEDTLRRVN